MLGLRQSIAVAELAGKLGGAERTDRNGDAIIDLTDVQIFRTENGLQSKPEPRGGCGTTDAVLVENEN